ncbi:hypothetical protein [Mangrovihabitans endophyticus]|uniref:Uncharacterized protein n=1 Tax=Mangrovihabitans endophyticus TaxID=1751298 RepID=A0A8J3FN65_9ACTN|nr:hypothetical protein [Mangrovihabitans endophyticus]GGK89417.1 hypothetical protein GCM10012284_24240 [Mangrovihabitans endophyticus]
MTARPRPDRVRPHPHVADDDVPADHRGRRRCTTCGLMSQAGDPRHPITPLPPPPPRFDPELVAAAAEREAAILGERDD